MKKLKCYVEFPWRYNMKKLKCYVEFPWRYNWRANDWKQYIPVCGGFSLSWKTYDFDLCDNNSYFPRGQKKGHHVFSIGVGAFYWWLYITIYYPKKINTIFLAQ